MKKEELCEKCKKKKWNVGVKFKRKMKLLCDDCAFGKTEKYRRMVK